MGIYIPINVCVQLTANPYKEMDLRCVFNTCANPSNLGAFKMETEQQAVELRMDRSTVPYHRYLGITALYYRS